MKHFKFIELILTTFSEFKSSIAIMQSGENPFGEMELSSQKRFEVTVSAENEKTTAQFPRQQVSLEWQSLFPTQTLYLSEIEAGDDYVKLTIGHTDSIDRDGPAASDRSRSAPRAARQLAPGGHAPPRTPLGIPLGAGLGTRVDRSSDEAGRRAGCPF